MARLHNLSFITSTDDRFDSAKRDIWKHRVINSDWPEEWRFYDARFNQLWVADEEFLSFLCEMVHPAVRPLTEEAHTLVAAYNAELNGWQLIEVKQISGRPVDGFERRGRPEGDLRSVDRVAESRSANRRSPITGWTVRKRMSSSKPWDCYAVKC